MRLAAEFPIGGEGLRGHGWMKATFKRPPVGRETFTGTVAG